MIITINLEYYLRILKAYVYIYLAIDNYLVLEYVKW